ncbi:MFS transporter [Devosia ginsengisoli]|uniref:MFS transporter n=1 Tax=Devosia ginsengisoli TaxID=400770 RepID=A0A5B8LXH0_9HYPH|nr:MFS transporter [Devosia ginsengisoli]QDZ12491.1 MFS transporter [Devosia ginsengisoli]
MSSDATVRRNIFVLALAQTLGGSNGPIVISLGGLVGQELTTDAALVTLPVSLYNLGLALGTLPAAFIMRRFGRRSGYLLGACCGTAAGLIAFLGIYWASFWIFSLGTFVAGFYASYVQSYRFAAADGVTGPLKGIAISSVMIGGLAAAILGPQLVIWTRESIPMLPFAGAFIGQAALALMAIPVLLLLRAPDRAEARQGQLSGGRPMGEILRTPRYMLAVAAGVVSYGLMTFVMTAAPIAMVHTGHSVDHAALGIQWHVLAMFAPSFVTGRLMARYGKEKITAIGLAIIGVSAMVALSGLDIGHFWVSLTLLGIGWNFGFLGATAMVTDCHTPEERSKVQGTNDFIVFGIVAIASFTSGALLNSSGWTMLNWLVLPAVALILVPLIWRIRQAPAATAA